LTELCFENCIFFKAAKPGLLMGQHVGEVLFKNLKIDGAAIEMPTVEAAGSIFPSPSV